MKKFTQLSFLFLAFVFTAITAQAQEDKNELPPKERWSLETHEGIVKEIDKEAQEVTVQGSEGNLLTITASEGMTRFDEISLGDVISLEYYEYLSAEFRSPTAEELAEPLLILTEEGRTPEGMDPGAAVGAVVRAVVTIEVLNRPKMTVTVKGPRGNYVTIDMEDEGLMQRLNIGQVVILTYAEAMALTLIKISDGE